MYQGTRCDAASYRANPIDAPAGGESQTLWIVKSATSDPRLMSMLAEPMVGDVTYNFSFSHRMYGSTISPAGFYLYAVKDPTDPWADYITLISDSTSLTNTSWLQFSHKFRVPSAQDRWYFCIYIYPSGSGNIWSAFDNFRIAKTSLLPNLSFEEPVLPSSTSLYGVSQGWSLDQGNSGNIYTYAGDVPSGGGSQILAVRGKDIRLSNVPVEPIKGGEDYTLSFYHRMYGSSTSAGVTLYAVKDLTLSNIWTTGNWTTLTSKTAELTNTSWQQPSLQFTAPASVNGWRFYIYIWPSLANVAVDWLKENRPNSLAYISGYEYGDSHLNAVVASGVDALMWQAYPYVYSEGTPTEYGHYYAGLAAYRSKARAYGLPAFVWIQTFGEIYGGNWRMPSESEFRMNVFSSLTAGFKGIGFFSWDSGLVDYYGSPTAIYYDAQDIKSDIHWLGNKLRFLDSTAMFFVPGPGHDTPPSGLTNWSSGADPDPHITDISIGGSSADKKDGLIGFFTDDVGNQYFMITNLFRGPSLSASQAQATFTITFDNDTNTIYRLRRDTGAQETVNLTNHQLVLTLDGGTGDLFSYTGF